MRKCEKCGKEFEPMCGGKPRLNEDGTLKEMEGSYLGSGVGTALKVCRDCFLRDK